MAPAIEQAIARLAELASLAEPRAQTARGHAPLGPAALPAAVSGNGASRVSLAEAQYRALIEQIPAVTFVASLAGGRSAIYVSPQIEVLLGFTQEEWTADPVIWYRQTHPADRGRVSDKFAKTCATGIPFRDVFRVFAKDGRMLWIDAAARFVRDDAGRLLFLQGVGFDVTEQVAAREAREDLIRTQAAKAEADRARAQVEEALRVRDEFFDIAAHELRTPITSLLGQAQLARRRLDREGPPDLERLAASLEVIVQQAARLTRLVSQLLDISRVDAGKLALELVPTDIVALVAGVIASAEIVRAGHRFAFTAPTELVMRLDPLRIEQVVTNLIDNAAKFSAPGSVIDVGVARDGGTVEISVRDRGIGIAPDRRDRIFERFYQAHDAHHATGLGLGLYVTRQIVELHAGTITAEFPSDGGTRFLVRLPANA